MPMLPTPFPIQATAPHHRRRQCAAACLVLAAGTLAGCAQLRATLTENVDGEASEQFSGVDKHSAYPAVRRQNFEQVNLIELIDPAGDARRRYAGAWAQAEAQGAGRFGRQYDLVLADFRERLPGMDASSAIRHRNAVQDRMLSVSTSRCNVFKTYLRRQQSDTNFLLGSATTVAGVLGAILPGATASRNLAGTAGIFSGVQAEFNSSYYSNLAAHVIVQGIEMQQQRLLSQLMKDRSTRSLTDYGMEAAIKDALYFDGTCSTVSGLIEAAESIKEVSNPGLPRAAEVIASVKAMNTIAQADGIAALSQTGELDRLLKLTAPKSSPLVVTSTQPTDPAQEARRANATAATASVRLALSIVQQADQIAAVFAAAQAALPAADRHANPDFGQMAAQAFQAEHKDLATTVRLADCEAALHAPTVELAKAQAGRDMVRDGSAQRFSAQAEVLAAAAKAQAAAQLVEWQLNQALDHLRASAARWKAALRDKNLKADSVVPDLDVKIKPLDPAVFDALGCPKAA
jgi:hypothetical protein